MPVAAFEHDRDEAVEAERREEREREHHAAELGEDTGRRDDQLAKPAAGSAGRDRPGEQPAQRRAPTIAVATDSWIERPNACRNVALPEARR